MNDDRSVQLDLLLADLIDLEKAPHTPSRKLLAQTIETLADYRELLIAEKKD